MDKDAIGSVEIAKVSRCIRVDIGMLLNSIERQEDSSNSDFRTNLLILSPSLLDIIETGA